MVGRKFLGSALVSVAAAQTAPPIPINAQAGLLNIPVSLSHPDFLEGYVVTLNSTDYLSNPRVRQSDIQQPDQSYRTYLWRYRSADLLQ